MRRWTQAGDVTGRMPVPHQRIGLFQGLIGDVSAGREKVVVAMSGGVDSNTLISIARKEFNYNVHGFTIVNRDERYAEQDLVDYAVAELGIKNDAIEVNPDHFIEKLKKLIASRLRLSGNMHAGRKQIRHFIQ